MLSLFALLLTVACVARPKAGPPPAAAALAAMERAWEAEREAARRGAVGDRPAARAALLDAAAVAPEWVVPRRELDLLDLAALRGPAVWERRLAAVEAAPDDASAQYLLGRLEGAEGTRRFERALALDGAMAWAHHALSVDRELRGRPGDALASERRALQLARDPFAAGLFATRVSSLAAEAGEDELALDVLADTLDGAPGAAHHAVALRLAQLELDSSDEDLVERGFRRGLALLRERPLTDAETAGLLGALQRGTRGRSQDAWEFAVVRALLAGWRAPGLGDGPATLVGRNLFSLQFELLRSDEPSTPREALRDAFRGGDYAGGARAWLAAQPTVVLDAAGQPRDARIRRVTETAARADRALPATQLELCRALLDAGWADVAEPLLADLGEVARAGRADAEAVAALAARARSIQAVIGEFDRIVAALHDGSKAWSLTPYDPDAEPGERTPPPGDLSGVLDALARVLTEYGREAGLEGDLRAELASSPRIRVGPFGAVIAPGPFHGRRDALLGLGAVGEPVPGLAAIADRLGRFALVGDALGRKPDGTLLLKLWAEERSGAHLGAPWSGVVIWCGGAEAHGSRSRSAGEVSGAALHEGYWIDVEAERARLPRWRSLARRFLSGEEDAGAILGLDAAPVPARYEGSARRAERRRLVPPLRQAERVALAVLRERAAARPDVPATELLTLDDLLEVVQVHEEGHLCDRERFLPLGRNLGRLLMLALRETVGDLGIERRVEYRAQAVALAAVSDPRLALIDLLDAAEVDTRRRTVHAFAYRRLLEDFLRELDRQFEADPSAWPLLDGERYFVHQLHRLGPEDVRRVALEVARSEGLVEE